MHPLQARRDVGGRVSAPQPRVASALALRQDQRAEVLVVDGGGAREVQRREEPVAQRPVAGPAPLLEGRADVVFGSRYLRPDTRRVLMTGTATTVFEGEIEID